MDDSTGSAVLAAASAELHRLWEAVVNREASDLESAEATVRDGVLAMGAMVLEAAVASRGTGKLGARMACPCGGAARFEGYRPKGVQTLVGWITLRRAYYVCAACGQGYCPLDAALGLRRDSLSPGVRRLVGRFGAVLPFAAAAGALADAARVQVSPSTVRTITEAVGARYEQTLATEIAVAWTAGFDNPDEYRPVVET